MHIGEPEAPVPILTAPRSSQPPREITPKIRQITLKVTVSIPFTPKIYQIRELCGTLCIIHAGYVSRLDRTLAHRILRGLLPGLLSMAWPRRDGDLPGNMPRRSSSIRIVNRDIMIFAWSVTGRLSEKKG